MVFVLGGLMNPQKLPRALILRGIVSIAFGLLAIFIPGPTLLAIALIFGAYAFVDGIYALISAVHLRQQKLSWGFSLFEGIVGLAAGVGSLLWPGITILALTVIVAAWALITGVMEISAAARMKWASGVSRFLFGLCGIISIILGAAMIAWPSLGVFTFLSLVAAYALISGVLFITVGVQTRKLAPIEPLPLPRDQSKDRVA